MRTDPKQQGLTLVEIIAAIGIMAYALTLLLAFFNYGTRLNDNSRNTAVALSHAQYVLEDVRATAYAAALTQIDAGHWTYADTAAVSEAGLSPLNSETVTTTRSGTPPVVTVQVGWNDAQSRARSLTLATILGGA